MAGLARSEHRKQYLDASLVPLERALLERASLVGAHYDVARRAFRVHGLSNDAMAMVLPDVVAEIVAGELRGLAEELHYW